MDAGRERGGTSWGWEGLGDSKDVVTLSISRAFHDAAHEKLDRPDAIQRDLALQMPGGMPMK